MPSANTNGQTNRTRWLSHADKSIAEESGRRAVSQAERAAEALGPCPEPKLEDGDRDLMARRKVRLGQPALSYSLMSSVHSLLNSFRQVR